MRRKLPKVRNDQVRRMVAGNVRAEMGRRGLSQREVADWLHVDQPVISNRLTGRTPFDTDELAIIAERLGVPIAALVSAPAYVDVTAGPRWHLTDEKPGRRPITHRLLIAGQAGQAWRAWQARRAVRRGLQVLETYANKGG